MKKRALSNMVAMLVGLLLSIVILHLMDGRQPARADEITSVDDDPPSASNSPTIERAVSPLTLDEILRATGNEAVQMVSNFLEKASSDEVIALLDAIEEGNTEIGFFANDPRAELPDVEN